MNILGYAKPQEFTVNSGALRVTDPCYKITTWCAHTLTDVLNGVWMADVEYSNEDTWGERISQLRVWHSGYSQEDCPPVYTERIGTEIGVDSGQAGFFDLDKFPKEGAEDREFYDKVCDITLAGVPYNILEDCGVIRWDNESPKRLNDPNRFSSNYDKRNRYYLDHYVDRYKDVVMEILEGKTPVEKDRMTYSTHYENYPQVLEAYGSLGGFGTIDFGAVSRSGYGDGGYSLYVARNDEGKIIAAKIIFIGDPFYEEEDELDD